MGHGRMSYQLKTVRLLLIFVNVIIFLIGATLISQSIEIFITRRFSTLTEFLPNIENVIMTKNRIISDEIICVILIIPGCFLLFLGFFGCSSIITQIPNLLYCYSIIMGIILIFQTIIIVLFICFRMIIIKKFLALLRRSIIEVYQGPLEENLQSISILWDWIMYHLKCCGMESKDDFNIAIKWNRTNPWFQHKYFQYPLTCCAINETFIIDPIVFNRVISCAMNGNDIYEMSCYQKFFNIIHTIPNYIFILVIFIGLIELFALTFVFILLNRSRIIHIMEQSPAIYSYRNNHGHLYFQI